MIPENLRQRMLKIQDRCDESGRLISFEIANFYVGRLQARSIVRSLPGVRILKEPSFIGAIRIYRDDEFIKFELGGHVFDVIEFFADNDTYIIGPDPREPTDEIHQIRAAFERAHPSLGSIGCLALTMILPFWVLFLIFAGLFKPSLLP